MESAEKRLERGPRRLKPLWCGLAGALPWHRQLWLVCQAAEKSKMRTEAVVNLHFAVAHELHLYHLNLVFDSNQATAGTTLCCIHTRPGRPQEPWPHRQGWQLWETLPEVFPRCQTGCFQESQGQPQLKRGATNIQMSQEKMKMFVGGLRVTGRLHHVNFNKWSTEFAQQVFATKQLGPARTPDAEHVAPLFSTVI